ncbi:ABC transporter ATP-binding protein [Microbacterium sp.]|uniref:ABC transporter ATP-binding protein n=1 Tax=Microbacterium sp. TaxID=51671 RepID=UPI0039E2AFBA
MIRTFLGLIPAADRGRLGAYLVLSVLSVILRAIGAVLFVPLLTALFGPAPADAFVWVGVLTAVTVAGWAVDAGAARLGFALGFALLDEAQHAIAEHVVRIRLAWFDAANTATARQAIAATGPDLVGLVVYLFTPLLGALLLPVAIGLALLPIAWPLGLAALAGVPVLLGALWASGRIVRRADAEAAEANSDVTERIVEFARTQAALRAARRADSARSLAGHALDAQHGSLLRLVLMQIPGQILFSLASQLCLVLLAGVTTVLTVGGDIGVPAAIALIVVIVRYLEPITMLGALAPALESTLGTVRRMRAVLAAPTDVEGDAVLDVDAAVSIEFQDVVFRYTDDGPAVLDGVSFTLDAGGSTALVGPSGSGKSTVLALIAGLRMPTAGRVLVGGVDVAELSAEARRALVTAVFQHPSLFDATIAENVRVGRADASDDEVAAALEVARAREVAERLGDGTVGEGGGSLSGGERQRVSIARALVKPAPILLIDEATSALDTENEAAVVRALADERRPRTRVIVAHRLDSIAGCERAVFLEDGRVIEQGSVEELRAAGGRFASFWREQVASSGWRIRDL